MLRTRNGILLAVLLVVACKSPTQKGFTTQGVFKGAVGKKIMLAELPFNAVNRIVADSVTLDSTAKFLLNTPQQPECMYQLFIENGPGILLINDVQNISIAADINHPETLAVQGSPASQSIKSFDSTLYSLYETWRSDLKISDSLSAIKKIPDSIKAPYTERVKNSHDRIQDYLKRTIDAEINGTAQYYMLGTASQLLLESVWQNLLKKALANHPKHAGMLSLKHRADSLKIVPNTIPDSTY